MEPIKRRSTASRSRPSAPKAFRSVLVPVELSPAAARVIDRVGRLPLAESGRVTLLHVVPQGLPPKESRKAERDALRLLEGEVRHLRKQVHRAVHVEPRVEVGAAAKEIVRCAAAEKAELVVMGRGEGRPLRDAFLGSTAERVVRESRRPVLVVRLSARGTYARPVLALDLDPAAHEAVRLLLRVVPPPRPPVEVIHAFELPYPGRVYPSLSEHEADARTEELRNRAIHRLAKLLVQAMAKANVRPEEAPVWRSHVRHGSARGVVEKAARKADADLLVLGTQGRSGAAHVFLGSVAGDLLRAAKCDVLVVPPPVAPRARR